MKNILIINQSAELYGSDKALLELLNNYPRDEFNPIVILHEKGPLTKRLQELDIQIIETSVIKVKRGILNFSFLLSLPLEVFRSFLKIRKELAGKRISLVHSNATSVFIGAFYSFFFRIPHLWHVHEIVEKPKRIAVIYPRIVNFFSDTVVFNSQATHNHFTKIFPKISRKSTIVHNGQNRTTPFLNLSEIKSKRAELLGDSAEKIIIGLIGRISRLKGQQLLLEAFNNVLKSNNTTHLVFVGSAPKGQEFYEQDLVDKIHALGIEKHVTLLPFTESIWPVYDCLDIVVVPSTEPESFGLVATEGMLSEKPVIASNLGGLKEIVLHNVTGYLFDPNNVSELEHYLLELSENAIKRKEMGIAGSIRVKTHFSTEKYVNSMCNVYQSLSS